MSSLFSGPDGISPWIENVTSRAILGKPPKDTKAKLVQVIGRGGPGWSAKKKKKTDGWPVPYLRIHDGACTILAVIAKDAQSSALEEKAPSRGCIVKISDWLITTERAACRQQMVVTPTNRPRRSRETMLCLLVQGKLETVGGQGIGTIGKPVDIHSSVEVRRSMQSIDYKGDVLWQRLQKSRGLANETLPWNNSPSTLPPTNPAKDLTSQSPTASKHHDASHIGLGNPTQVLMRLQSKASNDDAAPAHITNHAVENQPRSSKNNDSTRETPLGNPAQFLVSNSLHADAPIDVFAQIIAKARKHSQKEQQPKESAYPTTLRASSIAETVTKKPSRLSDPTTIGDASSLLFQGKHSTIDMILTLAKSQTETKFQARKATALEAGEGFTILSPDGKGIASFITNLDELQRLCSKVLQACEKQSDRKTQKQIGKPLDADSTTRPDEEDEVFVLDGYSTQEGSHQGVSKMLLGDSTCSSSSTLQQSTSRKSKTSKSTTSSKKQRLSNKTKLRVSKRRRLQRDPALTECTPSTTDGSSHKGIPQTDLFGLRKNLFLEQISETENSQKSHRESDDAAPSSECTPSTTDGSAHGGVSQTALKKLRRNLFLEPLMQSNTKTSHEEESLLLLE